MSSVRGRTPAAGGTTTVATAADEATTAPEQAHRGIAVLLFVLPITAVMAGAFSINGVTPHVVTSALFAVLGAAAILRPRRKISGLALTVALLVAVWAVVTLVHVVVLRAPITNEVTISFAGLTVLLGVAAVRVPHRTFDAFVVGWTFAYLLSAVVAIMEKYFGFVPENSYLVRRGYALETVGLSSLFGNPNGFGVFLIATSVVFLPFALAATRRRVRGLYLVLQLSTVYFMFESGSRTGLTCLFVVMVVTIWMLLRGHDMARAVLIVIVIAGIIVQLLTPSGALLLNGLRENSLFTDSDDGSFLLRFNLVRNGLSFFGESPLIGIGPDMYEVYMRSHTDLYPTSFITNPHNGFIEMLSQYGILVFALFIFLLVRSAVKGWALMRASEPKDRDYIIGLSQLLLVAMLPFAATMHSTFLGAPAAWLYLCAIIALERMAARPAGASAGRGQVHSAGWSGTRERHA